MRKLATIMIAGILSLSGLALAPAKAGESPSLQALANGAHRSAVNKARNVYRHPAQTLHFFGLQPDMTVVEMWPAAGWYTEIIAPYVNAQGQYYASVYVKNGDKEFNSSAVRMLRDKFAAHPDLYGKAKIVVMSPPTKVDVAPAGSADMVLTFRNLHNWLAMGNSQMMLKAIYKALKPGGIFGVVDHRGDESKRQDPKAPMGYINQAYAIKMIEKAGFKLVDASEINANSRDDRDHPKGVWTLPPTLALKDQDREKYLKIGESDRFTLKFMKPMKK